MSCIILNNLKMGAGCSCHVGGDGLAVVFLFFSKIGHNMGSASSRHTILLLSAWVQSSRDPLIGCLQLFWVLGWLILGLQLSSSMYSNVFKPKNHIISMLWVHGFYVVFSLGLWTVLRHLENGPRWCCMGVLVDWVVCFGLWASRVSPNNLLGVVWDILLD